MTTTAGPTPASEAVALPVASLGRRIAASLLDACVWAVIAIVPLVALGLITGDGFDDQSGFFATIDGESTPTQLLRTAADYLAIQVTWVLYLGYLAARRDAWNGRSIGKRAAGLRIVTTDGSPLGRRAAWTRAVLAGMVLSGFGTLGLLADAALDSAPTGTHIALGAATAAVAIALLTAVRGGRRQTLYDRIAGTIVVSEPTAAAGPVTFTRQGTPVTAPVASTGAESAPAAPPATSAPSTITPRPATWKTWSIVLAGVLVYLGGGAATIFSDQLVGPSPEATRILALRETKTAHATLRELERLGEACLDRGGTPDTCDEATELRTRGVVFADEFDASVDPVGTHAGKFGAVPDGDDDVLFYAFTGDDRIWSTTAGGGWLDRVCVTRAGDLCEHTPDW